jgi:hypothetical protein
MPFQAALLLHIAYSLLFSSYVSHAFLYHDPHLEIVTIFFCIRCNKVNIIISENKIVMTTKTVLFLN